MDSRNLAKNSNRTNDAALASINDCSLLSGYCWGEELFRSPLLAKINQLLNCKLTNHFITAPPRRTNVCSLLSFIIYATRVRVLWRVVLSGSDMLLSPGFSIPTPIAFARLGVRIRLLP